MFRNFPIAEVWDSIVDRSNAGSIRGGIMSALMKKPTLCIAIPAVTNTNRAVVTLKKYLPDNFRIPR